MYKAAGLVFEAYDCGPVFEARAEKYAVAEGEPEFTLFTTEAEIRSAQGVRTLDDDWLRYMLSGSKFYFELIKRCGMMLHSSAVVKDGRAYLISGDSGVGKSTHTGLWLKAFPEAYILNDDKPALIRSKGGFAACGTPWSGKHDISRPECVPLGGVAFIERAAEPFIEPMPAREAVKRIIPQTVRHISGERMGELLQTVDLLVRTVPFYRLGANMDEESALTAWRGMEAEIKY